MPIQGLLIHIIMLNTPQKSYQWYDFWEYYSIYNDQISGQLIVAWLTATSTAERRERTDSGNTKYRRHL